jgi:hypothetical protein
VLIITPVAGSMPEPRPQYLVSGDRATQILDAASSAALQASGVKLTTLSLETFTKLTTELVAETLDGVDPDTGKLLAEVMPDYLSQAAINALDLLDVTNHVDEQYVPTRLSATNLNAMVLAQNSTVVDIDPDGYPVVVGGASTTTDYNVTGNLTAGNLTAATAHADVFTANQSTTTYAETSALATVNQSVEPGAPAAGRVKVYSDANGRLNLKDASAKLYLIGNKRIVTNWPTTGDSQIGDEAILASTGEHRVYLGATKGWRLASTHEVSSLTERDAITSKYPGLKVFVAVGHEQEHVWGTDNKWHGTKTFAIDGVGTGFLNTDTATNDTNPHRGATYDLVDPGYEYTVRADVSAVVLTNNGVSTYVQLSTLDYGQDIAGYNLYRHSGSYLWVGGGGRNYHHHDFSGATKAPLSGSHRLAMDWFCTTPYSNSMLYGSGEGQHLVYEIIPA